MVEWFQGRPIPNCYRRQGWTHAECDVCVTKELDLKGILLALRKLSIRSLSSMCVHEIVIVLDHRSEEKKKEKDYTFQQ